MQPTRTERSRDLILDAAEAIFRDREFASTSVEEVARRAGLTRKTVYNLFSSKEQIVAELRARAEARYYPPIRARIADDAPALEILRDTLVGHGRWCAANQNVAVLALTGPANKPSTTANSGDVAFITLVKDIMVLGQQQGVIRKDEDAGNMALFLLGAHAQTIRHMLATDSFQDAKLKYVLRLLIEGMGGRSIPTKAAAVRRARTSSKSKRRS
ncbi:TetR/AcrR family transcriptional regulator [Bradyrhizobium sp. Ec3.3]|uniref:TetR/AcrR family transcriptional regulator n=1 Tax=Bradyrhizobium sp. Ec3.3 TaxID=189753 RepID=UPI000410C3C8|nr:TetR/AcrR family transcriptional regulator [Bradyrhizobium sp. Ec3.3]